MMKNIATAFLSASIAFCQAVMPAGKNAQCGEVECMYVRVPMAEAAPALGMPWPCDKILILAGPADQKVVAFEVTLRYRWKGQLVRSEHVAQKMPEGLGYLHVFFFDVTEVEIESIFVRELVRRSP